MYHCIFKSTEELGEITDATKRMDATCKAFSTSNKCEGESWIEDVTLYELPLADWPYSLREANMPYSGSILDQKFWSDVEHPI